MPDPAQPASPTPPQGAGAAPPQPPMGVSPATQPTANRGAEMAGVQKLALVTRELESILVMVGAGSEIGKDVLKAINSLVKHAPAGGATPASQQNQIQEMARKNAQSGQAINMLRQQGGAPGAAPQPMKAA